MCSNTLLAILLASAAGLCLLVLGASEWVSWAAVGVVVWAVQRGR